MLVTIEVGSGCGEADHYLGRSDHSHSQSDIEVAEVLAFGDVLSDTQRGEIESYLSKKWGVALA